jgi:hypothetical protein
MRSGTCCNKRGGHALILLLAEPLDIISAGVSRAAGRRVDCPDRAQTEQRTGIDTRSGLAVANAAGFDGLPSKDQPIRVVLSEK